MVVEIGCIQVSRAQGGVAQFTFEELCGRPLGAADYIALAQAFHTVFVVDIPAMSLQVRRLFQGIVQTT